MSPKKQGILGLLIATVLALPLFLFSVSNVNLNISEKANSEFVSEIPKGGVENYDELINATEIPVPETTDGPSNTQLPKTTGLENQFFTKYAMFIYSGFLLFTVLLLLYYRFKIRNNNTQ